MYVCMYVCIHVLKAWNGSLAYSQMTVCVPMHACMHVCMHVCIFIHGTESMEWVDSIFTDDGVCACLCACVPMQVCLLVCMHACMHVYLYMC